MTYIDTNEDKGQIVSIRLLTFSCIKCGARADFEVTRLNAGLPSHYMQDGTRSITYCREHLPPEASTLWTRENYI